MDKNSYENYEYLSASSVEDRSDQFLVVQDDGTYLSVNSREIQYVTEVQDVKEVLESVEPCTVYDVTPQQFYVDVDGSAELISMPDQFILPDEDGNLFANSYLLPVANTVEEQMEHESAMDDYKEPEMQLKTEMKEQDLTQMNACTEITLSDEQYHRLQEEGWILLETSEKIFMLDTLGLHDITSNDKLIQRLKIDTYHHDQSTVEQEQCNIETESNSITNSTLASLTNQQDTIQFIVGEDGVRICQGEACENPVSYITNPPQGIESISACESLYHDEEQCATRAETPCPKVLGIHHSVVEDTVEYKDTNEFSVSQEEIITQNPKLENSMCNEVLKSVPKNKFKIKTDLIFKDIPDKIVLGETPNGKKLVAKFTKIASGVQKHRDNQSLLKLNQQNETHKQAVPNKDIQEIPTPNTSLSESRFIGLIQQALNGYIDVQCSEEDIGAADKVISQLLQVPAFKPSVLNFNLAITKDVKIKDESGALSNKVIPTLVTGRVTSFEDQGYYFVHQPGLLQTLVNNSEKLNDDDTILHVHITETKQADNMTGVSITMTKRKLPSIMNFETRKKVTNTVYGCSACATVFQTEEQLKEHQEVQCMDLKDILTIDIDGNMKGYTTIDNSKERIYYCNQCQFKFTKLYNCLKHLNTHFKPTKDDAMKDNNKPLNSETITDPLEGMYKCKMCSSTYFYPSTLSKHIVTKHINVKPN